ncbi:MAG: cytochrome c [Terriglobales bacterium]
MRKRIYLALLTALFLIAAACSARSKPSSLETKLANVAKDVVIPLESQNLKNPTPDSELTVAQGRQIYIGHCALCHSLDGHGQNPLGLAMYPPAMDLTSPHVQGWKDAELYWIISNGIRLTGMPGWSGMLTSGDIWKVTRFIHALPKLTPAETTRLAALTAPAPLVSQGGAEGFPPRLPSGASSGPGGAAALRARDEAMIAYGKRILHQEDCVMCHTFDGQGGVVGPDLSNEAARGRSDAWLIGHFKDPAKYSPGTVMPAFDNLTPSQLQALVTLLQHARSAPSAKPKQ